MNEDKKSRNKKIVAGVILGVMFISVFAVFTVNTFDEVEVDPEQAMQLATCMRAKGWAMYGTEWCPHCQEQKAYFGEAFEEVLYVDCDKYAATCKELNVTGYPTWRSIDGNVYPGTRTLESLSALTECEVLV